MALAVLSRKIDGYAMKYTNEALNNQTCTTTDISTHFYVFTVETILIISPSYRYDSLVSALCNLGTIARQEKNL